MLYCESTNGVPVLCGVWMMIGKNHTGRYRSRQFGHGRGESLWMPDSCKGHRPVVLQLLTIQDRAAPMERLLYEISFDAPERSGESVVIDVGYVDRMLADIVGNDDLSRYIL